MMEKEEAEPIRIPPQYHVDQKLPLLRGTGQEVGLHEKRR
jgi:hypothetical protein